MELTDRQVKKLFREYWINLGYTNEAVSNIMSELSIDQMKYQLANAGYISICGGRVYAR